MAESLDPSPLSRLGAALRPDWARTVVARRVAAGALVVLAAVAALRSDPHADQVPIIVAARDLAPGTELTSDDVQLEKRPATTIPDGSLADASALTGATLAGPARRGEVLTDVRVLGSRLAQAAAGPDGRIVPLHLADTALLDLIRPGDVVDILAAAGAAPTGDLRPVVVATNAVVILVSEKLTGSGAGGDRVVLVALPAHSANEVAGAALGQTVTLTFH
jgi:Flp pilus assembly protein CpaB